MTTMERDKVDNLSDSNAPKFTGKYLDTFQTRLLSKDASLKDYIEFETFSKPYLNDLLKNELKRYDIYSFEQLINEMNKSKNDPTRNKYIDSAIIGVFQGLIAALRSVVR
jgi:hypothetical protein